MKSMRLNDLGLIIVIAIIGVVLFGGAKTEYKDWKSDLCPTCCEQVTTPGK